MVLDGTCKYWVDMYDTFILLSNTNSIKMELGCLKLFWLREFLI
jgi:hypothetical protein